MSNLPYDITSANEILQYSRRLTNKSLNEVVDLSRLIEKTNNKGRLGTMVEEYFFKYKPGPNKDHVPDFAEANIELKVTGVIKNSKKNESPYRAKERLVLTMIHYFGITQETWLSSSLMKKCSLMLLLFYLFEKNIPAADLKFVMQPLLWKFPEADLKIIEKDWLAIQQKVKDGKAHELSEGDTFYLGACRKGSGGPNESLKSQPFSNELAKARAFSLKPSYVNIIINSHAKETGLITTETEAKEGIESITIRKFNNLYGLPVKDIEKIYNFNPKDISAKNHLASLSLRVLGTTKKYIPEFEKSGIILKTIRLSPKGTPKEAISFPSFDFIEMSKEQWEDSLFYEKINQKFLFVIYQYDESGTLKFKGAKFWNMPYADREEARKVWGRAVDAINNGELNKLPKSSESSVAHVRPHGKNKADTLPLPNGGYFTKQCFWLNIQYIANQLSIKN